MRIVFMGTPDFAVGTLEELIKAGHEIIGIVTQPDKPKGRGKTLMPTPVKEVALKHQIPVYQPKKVREKEFTEALRNLSPDVIVVAAFGQIITKEILEIPRFGCINVHASLLPAYRGAAPIQWAVINGEKESGVTIMQMDEGLDTGDMIDKVVVPLAQDETGGSLFDKLSQAGARLCVKVLKDLEEGKAVREKQPEESTTPYASMISKKMGEINWSQPAGSIEQLIRGLDPWPSAYTKLQGKTLKLWKARVVEEKQEKGRPGEVVQVEKEAFFVQTGEGILKIEELQMEGKKRMDTGAFLRGFQLTCGEILG
ncbi:MAG TPA: methionyl-tRNA formyltransferase [Candidatus Blautia merdigallinarum]|uniref:Methionyl-tRNA formyltransferase n=1 Tax=Candidatus Blautia merdigallinarum TaxID=2838495 RepID=A0A9D2N4L0_9FIRM|nr:methionyl-tRNA formyltransferase [Candidatus Blautia merdigallinarum]